MMERRLSVLKICISFEFISSRFDYYYFFLKATQFYDISACNYSGNFSCETHFVVFFFSLTIIEGKKIGIRREHDSREKYLAHGK